jgi:hypothetical protein
MKRELMEVSNKNSLNSQMKLELERTKEDNVILTKRNEKLREQMRRMKVEIENSKVEIHVIQKQKKHIPKVRYFD